MKEQRYTLLEDHYFGMLMSVLTVFKENDCQPIIVGGVAVQAHVLSLVGLENAAKYLRKTDDYDMVIQNADGKKIIDIIKLLNNESFIIGDTIFSISVLRSGENKSCLRVEYLGGKDSKDEIKSFTIKLDISTKPGTLEYISTEQAEMMYKDATEVKIRHLRYASELEAKVLLIEDLIATKLSNGRKKDIKDVDTLVCVAGEKGLLIDWDKTKKRIDSMKDLYRRDIARRNMRAFKRILKDCRALVV